MAICNFSEHICYLQLFKKATAQSPEHFPKTQKLWRECAHGFCSMRWKPVVLPQALELVLFPLRGTASPKRTDSFLFPNFWDNQSSWAQGECALQKNVDFCSFFHVPEQEMDSNCIVKPITTSLYSSSPKDWHCLVFQKLDLLLPATRMGINWEKMQELSKQKPAQELLPVKQSWTESWKRSHPFISAGNSPSEQLIQGFNPFLKQKQQTSSV